MLLCWKEDGRRLRVPLIRGLCLCLGRACRYQEDENCSPGHAVHGSCCAPLRGDARGFFCVSLGFPCGIPGRNTPCLVARGGYHTGVQQCINTHAISYSPASLKTAPLPKRNLQQRRWSKGLRFEESPKRCVYE